MEFFIGALLAVGAIVVTAATFATSFKTLRESVVGLRDWISGLFAAPVELDYPKELRGSFVDTRGELVDILDLRRRVFKEWYGLDVISPDNGYWEAYERNKLAFSILSEQGVAFGYWGMIPVSEQNFKNFIEGKLTHDEMLCTATLTPSEVDPENVFLYFIGSVSMNKDCLKDGDPNIHQMQAKVVADSMNVAHKLSQNVTIRGIAVYASTRYGWQVAKKRLLSHGFKGTNVFASSENKLSEIMVLEEGQVKSFFDSVFDKELKPLLDHSQKMLTRVSMRPQKAFGFPEKMPKVAHRDQSELDAAFATLKSSGVSSESGNQASRNPLGS